MINDKYTKALIDSLDDATSTQVIDFVLDENKTVSALTITEKWDDGAPIIKYFRRKGKSVDYTFKAEEEYEIIYDKENDDVYFYDNGLWYLTDSSEFDFNELVEFQK